jgi:hypothetical protein
MTYFGILYEKTRIKNGIIADFAKKVSLQSCQSREIKKILTWEDDRLV